MEAGTLGDRRAAVVDAALEDARGTITDAAARLRSIGVQVREAVAPEHDLEATRDGDALRRGRVLLARLEGASRDLDETLGYLDGGSHSRTRRDSARIATEVQEQERARLAEELHDGPAQALSNATFQVEIVARALRADADQAHRELLALRAQLERAVDWMRGYIHQLRPGLEGAGELEPALEELARSIGDESGVAVRLDLAASEELLDIAERTAVLRVAQEALRNARKHAGASEVHVSTRLEEPAGRRTRGRGSPGPSWVLEVRDDGRGFTDPAPLDRRPERHFGLRFMQERARSVGGSLHIESRPTAGTSVRLVLEPKGRS